MTVIYLSQARQQRETLRQAVEHAAHGISEELTITAMRFADRAFAVAGPLAARDLELARVIYNGMRRRLLCKVRRETPAQIRPLAVEWARRVFRARLVERIKERDGKNGGAA